MLPSYSDMEIWYGCKTKKPSKKQNSAGSTLVAINKKRGDTARYVIDML